MRIKVWGPSEGVQELNKKKLEGHEIITEEVDAGIMQQCDLFIDLHPDKFYSRLDLYEQFYPVPVLVNCVKDNLFHIHAEYFGNKERFSLFGFNALPTFIQSPVAEVTVLDKTYQPRLETLMGLLGWDFSLVDDYVGMVGPRVVAMIINEAYYLLQTGVAGEDEVDTAMKLGAHYPFGPFEWCRRIGIRHIYELLDRLWQATHDERYKISPLLQRTYKSVIQEF